MGALVLAVSSKIYMLEFYIVATPGTSVQEHLPWLAPVLKKESAMARNIPEPVYEICQLEISIYRYKHRTQPRCILTIRSERGSYICFALSPKYPNAARVSISNLQSVRELPLTEEAKKLVAGVRRAHESSLVPVELIRMGIHYATFGSYEMKGVVEQVAIIVKAVGDAYTQSGRIRIILTESWTEKQLYELSVRLEEADCAGFIADIQMIRTNQPHITAYSMINTPE